MSNADSVEIIVADDLASARKILSRLLKKIGYSHIIECKNAREVLQSLENSNKVGLIISDRFMPDISGIELITSLRTNERTKKLPFLLISASAEDDDEGIIQKCGNAALLPKPFDSYTLYQKIYKLLNSSPRS